MARWIVAGAPCSGKSTFVRDHLHPSELVYDYDLMHVALSGQRLYQHDPAIKKYVFAARDAVFRELEANIQQAAYVVTATRRTSELQSLKERFGAEVILLTVDRDAAHNRCDADGRPQEWHRYIDEWFDQTDIDAVAWPLPEGAKSLGGREMAQKVYKGQIKFRKDADETGEFRAEFATLNVIDYDQDVTVPGAFQDGQETLIEAWNHSYGVLPAGKGIIHEQGDKAIIDGRFFLDTQSGLEHYKTVKEIGAIQEWSYTFDIEEWSEGEFDGQDVRFLRRLDVWGVAPVQRGAGIDTRTTDIKAAKDSKDSGGAGDSGAGDSGGAADSGGDGAGGDEGEAGDGKPSGRDPRDVQVQIDILTLLQEV